VRAELVERLWNAALVRHPDPDATVEDPQEVRRRPVGDPDPTPAGIEQRVQVPRQRRPDHVEPVAQFESIAGTVPGQCVQDPHPGR
jgi:hypothetical protein